MFCGFGFGVFYLSGCLVLVLRLRFVCLVNLGFAGGDLVLFGVVALWLRFVLVVLCGIVLDAGLGVVVCG